MCLWMWDLEPERVRGLVDWLDVDLVAAEDEQVEVDLARTPALTLLTAQRKLDSLERGE
jgi:hypothetical protein